jgi:hypothetical protein
MKFVALALTLAGIAHLEIAEAYCRTTTSAQQRNPTMCPTTGAPIAWLTGCTGVRINARVTSPNVSLDQFRQSIQESIRGWKTAVCNPLTRGVPSFEIVLLPDTTVEVGYEQSGANSNVLAFLANWGPDESHDPMAAAITIVTFGSRTGAILDADTEFNVGARFPFSFDGGPGTTDLRTVTTHELGHILGLAHSPDRNAVMWYTAGQGERRRTPNADDVAGVCAVYPPGRAVQCDPELRSQTLEGGGLSCAATPKRVPRWSFAALTVLVCFAVLKLRRIR